MRKTAALTLEVTKFEFIVNEETLLHNKLTLEKVHCISVKYNVTMSSDIKLQSHLHCLAVLNVCDLQ